MRRKPDVAIVGMGYVGLTLAVTLAGLGFRVAGYERDTKIAHQLNEGQPHIYEPGVEQVLRSQVGRNLTVDTHLPASLSGVVIICVSTPIGPDRRPDLGNLRAATESVAGSAKDGTLVIVRSTVPVGTCRNMVLPILEADQKRVHLACCPERTIQGQAMRELRQLPQVVGGIDDVSTAAAVQLWEQVTERVTRVSSLEAAEMVKLINNCHTDLLYSYGNEVAMMAHRLGLDPLELIHAANMDYPRPDLARPGFVGGPCMSKDPHLLLSSFAGTDYLPKLVSEARHINESLPGQVAQHFIDCLKGTDGDIEGAKILVCGMAYKGCPVTDDVRGSATIPILQYLHRYPLEIYVHDPMVAPETMSACGAGVVEDLLEGFDGARGVLFVNNHAEYRQADIVQLAKGLSTPALIYDCWRLFDHRIIEAIPGVRYASIGFG